jgi:hypothetical protein
VVYAPLREDNDTFAENFNIAVEELLSSNYPLDIYSETALDQLKSSFQNFRMEHLNANSSLSGYPAYYVDYTYTVPSPPGNTTTQEFTNLDYGRVQSVFMGRVKMLALLTYT